MTINDSILAQWTEQAKRDDWHKTFVGSDIRQMLGEIERYKYALLSSENAVKSLKIRCISLGDRLIEAEEKIKQGAFTITPKINIECETVNNGLTGSTSLNVVRVEREDDGSFTAVTDYWPKDDEVKRLKAQNVQALELLEIECQTTNQIACLLKFTPTHRHVKTGNLYQVIARGLDATNKHTIAPEIVIYCNEKGWFSRLASEFDDGRFEKLG